MIELCLEKISSRSIYDSIQPRLCQMSKGHTGKHAEFHYLEHLQNGHRLVAEKIKRDALMTTGAAWKSELAGPNRILRWVMLLSDTELDAFGIHMALYKPQVIAKLREKAASYDDCMDVARKLTWLVYQMPGVPKPPVEIQTYLEHFFSEMKSETTTCIVCRKELPFNLFSKAQRGKAEIETGHVSPRIHNAQNVGFAHRECNIAQGNKSLPEFYKWIKEILERVTQT